MKKTLGSTIKKIAGQELIYIILFSVVLFILSFASLYYYISITPPGTYFPLIHNHPEDFHLYIQFIRQAFDGRLFFISRYTVENFPARFTYLPYLLIGISARILHLDLPIAYQSARIVFGITFLVLIYKIIYSFYPQNKKARIISYFLVLFGSGFWYIKQINNISYIYRNLAFWTEINTLDRIFYIPHHLLAKVLMSLSILLLFSSVSKKSLKLLVLASIIGLLSGLSSPFVFINLILTLVITGFLYGVLFMIQKKKIPLFLIHAFIFCLISSLSLLYLRWVEQAGFPWKVYVDWEKNMFPLSPIDIFILYGPNAIISIFALPKMVLRRNLLDIFILSWVLEPLISILFFARYIPMQNIRFLSGSTFIPLGIIAAEGLFVLCSLLKRYIFIPQILTGAILLLIVSGISIGDMYSNYQDQISQYSPVYYNMYIPKQVMDGFAFLDAHTPVESVVMTGGYMGVLIPSFTHNITANGHPTMTYNGLQKGQEMYTYFAQSDVSAAKAVLTKNHIDYIMYNLDTNPPDEQFTKKLGLMKLFQEDRVVIYKVH